MQQFKPIFFVGVFIFFGAIGLSRASSAAVRTVDAIGLFSSGMGCGAAVFGFVSALRGSLRT
jgi:hypothetical protein